MKVKTPIPKDKSFDSTLSLLKEGFNFIPGRRKNLDSDIFETRLLGKKAVCMAGEEAAEVFYDNEKFKRKGAAPLPLKKSLLGVGGLHGMDGEFHHQRKRMHLSMMTPERLEDMKRIAVEKLDSKVDEWEKKEKVVFFEEMQEILTRAGCEWAGIPLKETEVKQRTAEIVAMVDAFGSVSRLRKGSKARNSQEKWLGEIIKKVRSGEIKAPPHTPAYIVAHHRDINGKKLSTHTAAVELSNAFRPLIAAANFLAFGVIALHEHPEEKDKIRENKDNYMQMFTQEVRRFYPFAPAMAARVKKNFEWHGYTFKKNRLVILDLFGTNRHPEYWEEPETFRPDRFKNWKESPFAFVPQGGGDHHAGHRCAGEWLTVMVMAAFFKYLTENITYQLPKQDLSYNMTRMPTMPKSHVVISNVKKIKASPIELIRHTPKHTVIKS